MISTTSFIILSLLSLTRAIPSLVEQTPLQHSIPASAPHAPKHLLDLHRELVEIESISGNEHAVGKYLVSYLKSIGLTVEIQQVKSSKAASGAVSQDGDVGAPWILEDGAGIESADSASRFNIYAYPGHNRHVDTLLTSHIDTVPPYIPYSISHAHPSSSAPSTNRTISGRGSVDAKASVAAMLTAYSSLHSSSATDITAKLPTLGFLFVVDEEVGGTGMRHASSTLNTTFRSVIFGEPTEGALACGHKGNLGFTIDVTGKAAHSGYPWLGVSANELLLLALNAVLNADLPTSEQYGNTTVNIGRMEGGIAGNVVAQHASALVTARLAGGTASTSRAIFIAAVESATKELLKKGGSVELKFTSGGYGPIDTDCDVEWWNGPTMSVNYGTDVPWLAGGHKRYLYGPGSILVAHSDHEAITVGDLEGAVRDYRRIILATKED